MKKQTFLQGAFILTAAGMISKVLGLVYRFPLSRLIDDVGMGLYGMVYPIYTLLLALSTAGVPVAISKLVSEKLVQGREKEARRIFHVALVSFSLIGFALSAGLFMDAHHLVKIGFVRDPRAYWGVLAVSPAVFVVSLLVSFRGYFQGWQMMTPTAVSQVWEQMIRVTTALVLGYFLLRYGVEFAAAGAVFGAVTGGLAALTVLLYYYLTRRRQLKLEYIAPERKVVQERGESGWRIFKRIISISVPISLAGLVMPIMQNIDLAMVPARLMRAGFDINQATAFYGQLSQMAATLVNMPTIITLSLAASVVPAISEAHAAKRLDLVNSRIATALRVAILLELPAFVGFLVLATPITIMLFDNAQAGKALEAISPAVLFLGLHQVTSGILQGLGKPMIPLKNLFTGAVAKVGLTFYLTAIPEIGVRGAAYGTVTAFVLASLLNLYSISRYATLRLNVLGMIIKPLFAVILMAAAVVEIYQSLYSFLGSNALSAMGAIAAGGMVYALVLLLTGGIIGKDIEMLPRIGRKTANILRTLRIVRD